MLYVQEGFIFVLKKLNCSVQITVPMERKRSSSSPISINFTPWLIAHEIVFLSAAALYCNTCTAQTPRGILTAWLGWQSSSCLLHHPAELSPKTFPSKRQGRTITITGSQMPRLPFSCPYSSSEGLLVKFYMMQTRRYEFQLEFLCTQCLVHPLGLCKFRSHANHTSFLPAICRHPH